MIFFHKYYSDCCAPPSDFSEHTNPQQDYGRIFTEFDLTELDLSVKIRTDKQGNGDEYTKKGELEQGSLKMKAETQVSL